MEITFQEDAVVVHFHAYNDTVTIEVEGDDQVSGGELELSIKDTATLFDALSDLMDLASKKGLI